MASEVAALTQALVRIPSINPGGTEEACARCVASWLEEHGLAVETDEVLPGRPNVVARVPGGDLPPLVYLAHMDTVPPGEGWQRDPFDGAIENGLLWGRGSADMKGGLAAAMVAVATVARSQPAGRRPLLLCATCDEEATMLGALRLVERGLITRDSLVVCQEPSDLKLVLAHKGVVWARLHLAGRLAHAGNPHLGIDAIHAGAAALMAVKQAVAALPDIHPLLGRTSVTAGGIRGGVKINVVPARCEIDLDARIVPPLTVASAAEIVRHAALQGIAAVPGASLHMELLTQDRPPVEAPGDTEVALALRAAFAAAMGREMELAGYPAYTDAAIAAVRSGNRQWAVFGPGHLDQAHTDHEHVPVEQLEQAAEILTRAALALRG